MPAINLSPLTAEQESLDRRRKMAEAMQQQAILPIEMPTVPGAKVSHAQGLAKLLQGYIAGKNLERAEEEKKQYETDYMSDIGFLLRNAGQSETIPGNVITPAKEAVMQPAMPIQENVDQQKALSDLTFPDPTNAARAAIGLNLMRPEDKQRITNLPAMSEEKMIEPAVAEVRAPSRQVPLLSPDLLSPENAQRYIKTSAGKTALAQYLLQQQAQQQAKAEKALEIRSRDPDQELYRMVDGKIEIVSPSKPKAILPKWEKSSKFDDDGKEIMGWVNTNASDIPASFVKGTVKPAMTEAQRLESELRLYATDVEAGKAEDVGRKPLRFERLPKGVPVGAKRTGKTPDGKDVFELNGKKYVGE